MTQRSVANLAEFQTQSEAKLASVSGECSTKITEINQKFAATLATERQDSEAKLAAVREESAAKISEVSQQSKAELITVRETFEAKLTESGMKSEAKIAELRLEFEAKLAEMRQESDTQHAQIAPTCHHDKTEVTIRSKSREDAEILSVNFHVQMRKVEEEGARALQASKEEGACFEGERNAARRDAQDLVSCYYIIKSYYRGTSLAINNTPSRFYSRYASLGFYSRNMHRAL